MRILVLGLSILNLIYLITTIAANEAGNIYLSPIGLPYYSHRSRDIKCGHTLNHANRRRQSQETQPVGNTG